MGIPLLMSPWDINNNYATLQNLFQVSLNGLATLDLMLFDSPL